MDRRLTRSRDAMIGGVASGVADWINADPALVRIAWAILVPLTGGLALLAYIVAWIVIPEEPRRAEPATAGAAVPADGETVAAAEPVASAERRGGGGDRTALFIGGGLIVLGGWFLVREYLPDIRWNLVWPVGLVALGILILVVSTRRR